MSVFPSAATALLPDRTLLREHVGALLGAYRPGYALPGAFYTDETLHRAELELIFGRHWLFVAAEPELPEPGDYRTYQIGRYPIFVLRKDDGGIVAFHNTCRHRGSRILQQEIGIVGSTLMCPYHRWTYDTDGRLVGCGTDGNPTDDGSVGLKPIHIKRVAGLVFVCLADEPPADFDDFAARVTPYLAPHDLANLKVAHQADLVENGNWKLTIENNRECFHCAGHPELLKTLFHFLGDVPEESSLAADEHEPYLRFMRARSESIAAWERDGLPWKPLHELHGRPTGFRAERFVLDGAGESMTLDTRVASRRLLGTLTNPRLGTQSVHVQPNMWFHFLSDHVMTFLVLPLDTRRTLVRTTWFVHADAVEGVDYEVEALTRVWQATNRQDAQLVEETQRGVTSPAYVPGPLGRAETWVDDFHRWYTERLRAALAL